VARLTSLRRWNGSAISRRSFGRRTERSIQRRRRRSGANGSKRGCQRGPQNQGELRDTSCGCPCHPLSSESTKNSARCCGAPASYSDGLAARSVGE
jgi:hypothetical protein